LIFTGTPIHLNPVDAINLFNLVMPGFVSVSDDEKKILQKASLDELNEMGIVISNSIVRRLTEDVLELPTRNEIIVFIK
jgi:SNF2 family DNA or RNA helicase